MAGYSLSDVSPPAVSAPTAAQATTGLPFQPAQLIALMSPTDWEAFTREWLQGLKGEYASIKRLSGPGDLGLDVVAFSTADLFDGDWDSYQCKHYAAPLVPTNVWVEFGKIIYHSFAKSPPLDGAKPVPRKHYFCAPHGVGLSLSKLLGRPPNLKEELRAKWDQYCRKGIGSNIDAPLQGALLTWFDGFDFSIFAHKEPIDLVAAHSKTPFHVARFGTAFPPKPPMPPVPGTPAAAESVYLRKILDAYANNQGKPFPSELELSAYPELRTHYDRQRQLFYSAEYLKGYARDTVPDGVFAALSDDIYHGVVDVADSAHTCGLTRMRIVISQAASVSVAGNALQSVATVPEMHSLHSVCRSKLPIKFALPD